MDLLLCRGRTGKGLQARKQASIKQANTIINTRLAHAPEVGHRLPLGAERCFRSDDERDVVPSASTRRARRTMVAEEGMGSKGPDRSHRSIDGKGIPSHQSLGRSAHYFPLGASCVLREGAVAVELLCPNPPTPFTLLLFVGRSTQAPAPRLLSLPMRFDSD